jgi:hypothetical protein
MVTFRNIPTSGKLKHLRLIQASIFVILNALNGCVMDGKPRGMKATKVFVRLPAIPFRIYQNSQSILKRHISICIIAVHLLF